MAASINFIIEPNSTADERASPFQSGGAKGRPARGTSRPPRLGRRRFTRRQLERNLLNRRDAKPSGSLQWHHCAEQTVIASVRFPFFLSRPVCGRCRTSPCREAVRSPASRNL